MLNIAAIRKTAPSIICIGRNPQIIQSMLDFDYLTGNKTPSVKAIITSGRKFEKLFFGNQDILVPCYPTLSVLPAEIYKKTTFLAFFVSGRRVLVNTEEALDRFPHVVAGTVFAENVPEVHSLQMYKKAHLNNNVIIGPASVGLIIPGTVKLGAIGGIQPDHIIHSNLVHVGKTAVFSASGGMTNELLSTLAQLQKGISFALSFGGDRFPCFTPKEAFLAAEYDPETAVVVYFGELGGYDEYELAGLLDTKKITKKVIAYIAGTISEMFETPPQFGHAKAMAENKNESAIEKRRALQDAGAIVPETFVDFIQELTRLPELTKKKNMSYSILEAMKDRKHTLFSSSISKDVNDQVFVLGEDIVSMAKKKSFAAIVASMLLGKKNISKELETFIDFTLKLLIDHGPYQSGVINTMVTARAGRDLVSSLAAGLLTIGPRFGGAINTAAANWLQGVQDEMKPEVFVESYAKKKLYIPGIGHRKYSLDNPDPRVMELLHYIKKLQKKKFTSFAQQIQNITTVKKGTLILNIDGAIAAVSLDILHECEGMSYTDLQKLVESEFFNALFVLSRSVGFVAHFLDQKRLDEGLVRLSSSDVTEVTPEH